jgi:AmmeMemoRadiSam system protein A
MLSADQRRHLLETARASVVARVSGSQVDSPAWIDCPTASGVFVTLKVGGQLRGCLGTLECDDELAAEVARCAADASSADSRFSPVRQSELQDLSVEVSVLGPLERIEPDRNGVDRSITIGRHGLVVEQGRRRGLLLPQVATERAWTGEQFLRQTCVKAAVSPEAWQHGATVYRFAAEVFGDEP